VEFSIIQINENKIKHNDNDDDVKSNIFPRNIFIETFLNVEFGMK
jgi:hypothetical protein